MFIVLGLLTTIAAATPVNPFSRFEKTNVIDSACDKSWLLQSGQASNIFQCGLRCNDDMDCRRFLFCKTSSTCKLYGDGTDCVVKGDAGSCQCYIKVIGCHGENCTCPWGLYGDNCQNIVTDCNDAILKGMKMNKSVVTRIKPISAPEAFDVICWLKGPASVTLLNRFRSCSQVNFNRTFQEYQEGFGIGPWDNWLGLEKILAILNSPQSFTLHVHLVTSQRDVCSIYYVNFTMGNATTKYQFRTVGYYNTSYRSTCGDSLTGSNNTLNLRGRPFSTYDNDETSSHCAARFGGGWWFADDPNCTDSLLTATDFHDNFWNNMFWEPNMKYVTMKLIFTT